jgi:hypothetical protein
MKKVHVAAQSHTGHHAKDEFPPTIPATIYRRINHHSSAIAAAITPLPLALV